MERPRIVEVRTAAANLFFTTLRVETECSVGTGFIFEHKWRCPRTSRTLTGMFLITNKHVVAGARSLLLSLARRRTKEDEPNLEERVSVGVSGRDWGWWMTHPSEDVDVAAFPLNPMLEDLKAEGNTPFFSCVSGDILPDSGRHGALNAVENVVFVGYPNGVFDTKNHLPIMRRGITATSPDIDYEGNPIFLIDASVFPGSSGSPVFVYDRGSWLSGGANWTVGSERVVFLGVLASVLYRESDGVLEFREVPTARHVVPVGREMIDLGVVYKARTVIETIEEGLRRIGQL